MENFHFGHKHTSLHLSLSKIGTLCYSTLYAGAAQSLKGSFCKMMFPLRLQYLTESGFIAAKLTSCYDRDKLFKIRPVDIEPVCVSFCLYVAEAVCCRYIDII